MKTSFKHPVSNGEIYIIWDPYHMLKLVRNTLGDKKIMFNGTRDIEWKYVSKLQDIAEEEGIHLGVKICSPHIEFQK